jgi:hypothetical protein
MELRPDLRQAREYFDDGPAEQVLLNVVIFAPRDDRSCTPVPIDDQITMISAGAGRFRID